MEGKGNDAEVASGRKVKEIAPKSIVRALLISLLLMPLNSYWMVEMEMIRNIGHPTSVSLFFNVVFILLLLILFNLLIHRILPRAVLRPDELLIIYIMLSVASAICGASFLPLLLPILGHAFWYATPENEWKELFHQYIPKWLSIQDKDALRGYYEGDSTLYTVEHLKTLGIPILMWALFAFALLFVMLCINAMIRKRWTEEERLSYPIVQLPLEMASFPPSFFRNRLLFWGILLSAGIELAAGVHQIYPAIPAISVTPRNVGRYFTEKPWNALGGMTISFFPFVIGLGFLIPLLPQFCELARRDNVYLDTSFLHIYRKIRDAVEMAGAEKIVWGSDGFLMHPVVELAKVKCLKLPKEDEAIILGGNIAKLLEMQVC